MKKDLHRDIVSMVGEKTVLFLAVVDTAKSLEDYGYNFLAMIADEVISQELPLLQTLDACVDMLSVAMWKVPQALKAAITTWLRLLLSQRQILVDVEVSAAILHRQKLVCNELQVVISTVTNLVKVQAQQSEWKSWLPADRQTMFWGDEVECTKWPYVASALPGFDVA